MWHGSWIADGEEQLAVALLRAKTKEKAIFFAAALARKLRRHITGNDILNDPTPAPRSGFGQTAIGLSLFLPCVRCQKLRG